VIDEPDRAHILQADVLGQRHAGRIVGIDADHETIRLLRRKPQQPQMSGMDDVEIARDERNRLVIAATRSDRLRIGYCPVRVAIIQCCTLRTSDRDRSQRISSRIRGYWNVTWESVVSRECRDVGCCDDRECRKSGYRPRITGGDIIARTAG